jgi:two-component system alkaline phosphatase synthesis response regulator PhoP
MNEKILIIEDEEELCMTLGDRLRSEGYVVDFAFNGCTGLQKASESAFDLIILDIMLPLRNGLDVCSDLRRAGLAMPILLLTAKCQTVEKVVGLKLGADDYVTKPFDTFELMARIEVLLRRTPSLRQAAQSKDRDVYEFGPIVVDIRKSRVTRYGEVVNLTAREFQLLHYFAEHQGITVTRDELLQKVWGHLDGTLTRTVDVHIAGLRQKLEENPRKPEMIITVPGIGYKFMD